jgi:hypothetical protein
MGDQHYLDTPICKDIFAGLATFRFIFKVTIGNGISTFFWLDLWLGDAPLSLSVSLLSTLTLSDLMLVCPSSSAPASKVT